MMKVEVAWFTLAVNVPVNSGVLYYGSKIKRFYVGGQSCCPAELVGSVAGVLVLDIVDKELTVSFNTSERFP